MTSPTSQPAADRPAVTPPRVNRGDPDYCTLCRQLGPCVNCDMNHSRWADR